MVALGTRPKGGVKAPFGLFAFALILLPATTIGSQDLAAQLAPKFAAEVRPPAIASPFGTIHLATFVFPQPLGTAMPKPMDLTPVSLDPGDMGIVDPIVPDSRVPAKADETTFPDVDRRHKGDALVTPPSHAKPEIAALEPQESPAAAQPQQPSESIVELSGDDDVSPHGETSDLATALNPTMDTARLYFGVGSMDAPAPELERTPTENEAPPDAAAEVPPAKEVPVKPTSSKGGETTAAKGIVTAERVRPRTPAERLGLSGKSRARSEKCLANAVYFESRGEPVRGQIAVAQVVMNRVFSDFYPDNVCDVVYQNSKRHLSCQFTFACDGIPDIVTEPEAWRRATRIAKDMLEGKLWLTEVGRATHYHAYWVHPSWVHEMRKMYKLGVHTFYRPRAWGDGSDEPDWGGDPKVTAALAKKL